MCRRLTYHKRIWISCFGFSLLIGFMFLSGCASRYGRLQANRDVTNLFETYQILGDYRYYYSGPDARPYAVMGIHREYSLGSKLWKPVDLTEAQLKSWIQSGMHRRFFRTPYGYDILDSTGKRIGIWYSMWPTTTIKTESDNRVMVYTPFSNSGSVTPPNDP